MGSCEEGAPEVLPGVLLGQEVANEAEDDHIEKAVEGPSGKNLRQK